MAPTIPCHPNELIASLCQSGAFGPPDDPPQFIETHISWIVLASEYAWKFKKPVDFGFLDFKRLENRKFYCEEELRLNRRTAPRLYLDVISINGSNRKPQINGPGPALEYALKMRRFPDNQLLSTLLANGQLQTKTASTLASVVADLHHSAGRAVDNEFSNSGQNGSWFEENFEHIQPLLSDPETLARLDQLQDYGRAQRIKLLPLMKRRSSAGFIRECHGDLHLGNIVMIEARPVLFDCIEFNPRLRWIDVMSDVAFLVMDLHYNRRPDLATAFLNRYLQITGDYEGLALLNYFIVYRALVRAKVALLRDPPATETTWSDLPKDFKQHLTLAKQFANPINPWLFITRGLSGSGKSTFAKALSAKTNAVVIRSDIERKRLAGLNESAETNTPPGVGIYGLGFSTKTYQYLLLIARRCLSAGYSVIVDAAFLKQDQRQPFQSLASEQAGGFIILNILAPTQTLKKRISHRLETKQDVSEANIAVLEKQTETAEALTNKELSYSVDLHSEEISLDVDLPEKIIAITRQRFPNLPVNQCVF